MLSFIYTLLTLSSVSAGPSSGKTYTISPSAFPNLCLAPSGDWDGARLTLADCNSDNIAWMFDGSSLKNTATNRCTDVLDGGHWNGNGLQTWTCFDHNTNQKFTPSNGAIKWTGQNMCLDLTDGRGQTGNNIQLWQCFDHNTNQQWTFEEVDEVEEDCETTSTVLPSATVAPSASASGSTIGGGLWASVTSSSASVATSIAVSASASADWSSSASASASADWSLSASASASADWSASASISASFAVTSVSSALPSATYTPSTSGLSQLRVQGTKVVDANGNNFQFKGTNLGGWLVWEDWMCGITDNSGSGDRFPQTTLTNRFGEDGARQLIKVWEDNWLVESHFDILAQMGFNVLRLPFSYRNFVRADGSYITDSNGNLDYSRLEWAIAQAKKRGMYVIPTYHIWEGQEQRYSTVSEDTWEGQQQRNRMGDLWTKIATHFVGETAIAGYDAINEPTGSANNNLQRDLYKAIRAGDPNVIIIMESIHAAPDSDWTNVMYSMHEYLMMGETDIGYNQYMFQQGAQKDINSYTALGVPTYVGEFMAGGETLTWMLDQMNQQQAHWSSWSFISVDRDRWALYNYGGDMRVDVSADSFESIRARWSSMGGISKSRVADQYASAAGGSAQNFKRRSLHGGRSRRR